MKTRALVQALETARKRFDREVSQVAELARDQFVPYFQKRGWSYKAGNGAWLIDDHRGRLIEDHQLPAAVRDVLYLEVEMGQPLGLYIRDITREATS